MQPEHKSLQPAPTAAFTIGRKVGIVLLLQLAAALTLPFILTKPLTVGSPAFLNDVAAHSLQIRLAVLLSFVGSALTVYLGITAFPEFWRRSKHAALLFLIVCVISCILDVVQAGTIMSMLAQSNRFVAAGGVLSETYELVAASVASARRSAHAVQLLAISTWIFVFYMILLRFRLLPRWLAAIGVAGVALQFTGVTLMMFLGYPAVGQMAMPLLPIQILVGVWLIVKGFSDLPARSGALAGDIT